MNELSSERTLRFVARKAGSPRAALVYWLDVLEPSIEASVTEVIQRLGPLMQVVFPDDRPGAFVNRSALLDIQHLGIIDRLVFLDGSWLDVWNDRDCIDICNLYSSRRHTCCLQRTSR